MIATMVKFLKTAYNKRRLDRLMNHCLSVATIDDNFALGPLGLICNESGDPSRIMIGNNSRLNGHIVSTSEGIVRVGHYSTIMEGARIRCVRSIQIGSFVAIAEKTIITDNNTHTTNIEGWLEHRIRVAPGGPGYPGFGYGWEASKSAPVVIGDGVWIGSHCMILKGVTIGEGAIIASCSVITKDVDPFSIVAGNPARKVKQLPVPDLSVMELAEIILSRKYKS